MLEIQLLKVTHLGEGEAGKLVPYIQKADVYSPESAGLTIDGAVFMEDDWQQSVLQHDWSIPALQSAFETVLSYLPPSHRDYAVAEKIHLYQNKIPLWYLERFSAISSENVLKMKQQSDDESESSIKMLAKGNVEEYLNMLWHSLQHVSEACVLRDKEIAGNLDNAYENISERYTYLSSKENLKLVAVIGSLHHPERYTSLDIEVVNLGREPTSLSERLGQGLESELSFEEMKPIMLDYGMLQLSVRGMVNLTRFEIEHMDHSELMTELRKLSSQ